MRVRARAHALTHTPTGSHAHAPTRAHTQVLPLGTGNDLARVLGWGGGYSGEELEEVLETVTHAYPVYLDRWNVQLRSVVCQLCVFVCVSSCVCLCVCL